MSETLAVTGTSEFTAAVTCKDSLVVDTTTQLKGAVQCDSDVLISGDLRVNGTTVTVNSEQVLITDNLMVLNSTGLPSKDSGLLFKRQTGVDNEAFFFDESDNTSYKTVIFKLYNILIDYYFNATLTYYMKIV